MNPAKKEVLEARMLSGESFGLVEVHNKKSLQNKKRGEVETNIYCPICDKAYLFQKGMNYRCGYCGEEYKKDKQNF